MKTIINFFFLFTILVGHAQEDFYTYIKKANLALNESKYVEALTNFEDAFKQQLPDSSVVAWNAGLAGICAQELQNNEKATEYFLMAIQYKTTDLDIYNRILIIAENTKNNEVKEKVLIAGKQNFPELASKNNSKLLYLYYNSQQYDKTIEIAEEILNEKPNQEKVKYLKSYALYKTDKTELAIDELNSILSDNPENEDANSMLGIIYYQMATDKYDGFTENYNKLKNPDRMDYFYYTKNTQNCKPDYEKALPYLIKAYDMKKDNMLRVAIFNSYIRMEQKSKAEKYR
jgi:tetratricopeptide (TPR) repeat protein